MGHVIDTSRILRALGTIRPMCEADLESHLHTDIDAALNGAAIVFEHERVLGPGCRIDFLCEGGIGIEVKKGKPASAALEAQAARYAAFDAVRSLILVVERNVFSVPAEANGKPVEVVALTSNWGVSL